MIGERLKDIRDESRITQKEMANILNITRGHYSAWEIGTEIIPLKKINVICNYFNVSMDFIIGKSRNKIGNGSHDLDKKVIGENIKIVRKKNNLSQRDLALALNTSHSTIGAYERGEKCILTAFAIQISKTYDVSLDWLCGRIK